MRESTQVRRKLYAKIARKFGQSTVLHLLEVGDEVLHIVVSWEIGVECLEEQLLFVRERGASNQLEQVAEIVPTMEANPCHFFIEE